jgi:hypothetical protein
VTGYYVSQDELNKYDEPITGFNPYIDANYTHPPPRPGNYKVQVMYVESRPDQRWQLQSSKRHGQKFRVARFNLRVLEGPSAGRITPFDVTTFHAGRYGSKAEELAVALGFGGQARRCKLVSDLIRLLNPTQQELGICMVSLEWRAWHRSHAGKVTDFKRMSQFPKLDKKNYEWRLELDGEEFYAENYVRAWKPCDRPLQEFRQVSR